MGLYASGRSKQAFQGELTCPFCRSKAVRFVEDVTPLRLRYRCRKCARTFQYDISNRTDLNPYAAYSNQSKFSQHLRKILGGRKLKGEIK